MDPDGSGARAQAEARAFDALYQAHYRDLVALLHALTGDLGDAQDLAQDVFCRAWQRWRAIAGYDDPVAWLRRVAVNLATSRFRRRRTADRHLARQQVEVVPALQPDHVALVAALRTLPTNQRTAMVLHYLVDLPVADVAQELGVPVGTVKAWLSRGRTALATQLSEAGATGLDAEDRADADPSGRTAGSVNGGRA
ncbi:MAG: SigE family RNA polymerase sigma factor [Micromonosporaceae bacterium]|nr:SigE family RNA polymerase sigma factor [Micromonosporaceae bacterium]